MNPKRWISAVAIAMVVLGPGLAKGQALNLASEPTAEQKARVAESGRLAEQGRDLLKQNKPEQALVLFLRSLEVEPGPYPVEGTLHGLAEAYSKLGRFQEALTTYRRATLWNPGEGRLLAGTQLLMDYAILLARRGRSEQAKAVYYEGLRGLNVEGEVLNEPIPLLAVFDADEDADVRPYSPDNLEAAALMVKAIFADDTTDLSRVRSLAPDWNYPVLYGILRLPLVRGVEVVDRALAAAKTDTERNALQDLRERTMKNYEDGNLYRGNVRARLDSLQSSQELLKMKGGDLATPRSS